MCIIKGRKKWSWANLYSCDRFPQRGNSWQREGQCVNLLLDHFADPPCEGVLTRALTLINTIRYYSWDKSLHIGLGDKWCWGVGGGWYGDWGDAILGPYLWSFLLRSRLCSWMDSWEAPEVPSIGSCFTWTGLNRPAWACCPFPEERQTARERQQSYCWSALLPCDEIQSDLCPDWGEDWEW